MSNYKICFLSAIFLVLTLAFVIDSVYISNLDAGCMRCLCHGATGCNHTFGCTKAHCGPLYISRPYWIDGDSHVLPEDDPARVGAFEDCANEYTCAKVIVENYMARYGRDCNQDGVTDCDDYASIHFNGGNNCEASLEGSTVHTRYTRCRPPKPEEIDEDSPQKR